MDPQKKGRGVGGERFVKGQRGEKKKSKGNGKTNQDLAKEEPREGSLKEGSQADKGKKTLRKRGRVSNEGRSS